MSTLNKKLGLIAGNGKLPFLIADACQRQGLKICLAAIKGETDPALEKRCADVEWVKLGQIGKVTQFFQSHEVNQAVMAGKITKTNIFKGEVWPDLDMIKILASTRDSKDDTLLGAVASHLESKGITLLSSVALLNDCLPKAGILSKKKPSQKDGDEIKFAFNAAKQIAGLDIGQVVVTKNKAVLAVEAIEGTDEAIRRGAALGGDAVIVTKVAKPNQDMRFDVPTIGLQTLHVLIDCKVRMLVIESGKTILMDREEFMKKADKHGLIVVAHERNQHAH